MRHVRVVDVQSGHILTDQTVFVTGNRITCVGSSRTNACPGGGVVIDAQGAYLVPGLWEMHSHEADDATMRAIFYPLYVANGVTGTRDMWGDDSALARRVDVKGGALLGPRIVVGSPIVDGPKPMWPGSIAVATPAYARHVTDSLKDRGYDFIKTYQFLPRDVYFAIADEARRVHITFAGHVPFSVSAGEASDSGQRSLEHAIGVSLACSTDEARLRGDLVASVTALDSSFDPHAALLGRGEGAPLATFSPAKCRVLFATLKRNNTWVVPTLTLWHTVVVAHDSATRRSPRLGYIPDAMRRDWVEATKGDYIAADSILHGTAVFRRLSNLTRAMQAAGVGLLAGTDQLNAYVYPGFSLHDELALFVEAGLTPLQALQTATVNPATFLGTLDSLGTVEPGKIADLVLLEANPLADIHNTTRIRAVVLNGRYFSRADLDGLLAGARRAARSPPASP